MKSIKTTRMIHNQSGIQSTKTFTMNGEIWKFSLLCLLFLIIFHAYVIFVDWRDAKMILYRSKYFLFLYHYNPRRVWWYLTYLHLLIKTRKIQWKFFTFGEDRTQLQVSQMFQNLSEFDLLNIRLLSENKEGIGSVSILSHSKS